MATILRDSGFEFFDLFLDADPIESGAALDFGGDDLEGRITRRNQFEKLLLVRWTVMTQEIEPVSYTHLDVYKRQLQDRREVKVDLGLQCGEPVLGLRRHITTQLFNQSLGIGELPDQLCGGQLGLIPLK